MAACITVGGRLRRIRLVGAVAGLGSTSVMAAAGGCGPALLPFSAQVGAVVCDAKLAGMRVDIAQFSSPLPVEQGLAEAASRWRTSSSDPVIQTQVAGWQTLSRRSALGVTNLQMRASADGGSVGLVSYWRFDAQGHSKLFATARALAPAHVVASRPIEFDDRQTQAVTFCWNEVGFAKAAVAAVAARARALGLQPVDAARTQGGEASRSASLLLQGDAVQGVLTAISSGNAVDLMLILRGGVR
jgi:hypothetical protein